MRLSSINRRIAAPFSLALLLVACATAAPPLPEQRSGVRPLESFTPEDAAKTCDDIRRNWQTTAKARDTVNRNIAANRTDNQVAGFIGVFFLPAAIATEGNYGDKDALVAIQARRDILIELARTKGCPALT